MKGCYLLSITPPNEVMSAGEAIPDEVDLQGHLQVPEMTETYYL